MKKLLEKIDKSSDEISIWEKLKKGKSLLQKKEKDITIDFIKFMPKNQMLERCNNIYFHEKYSNEIN